MKPMNRALDRGETITTTAQNDLLTWENRNGPLTPEAINYAWQLWFEGFKR